LIQLRRRALLMGPAAALLLQGCGGKPPPPPPPAILNLTVNAGKTQNPEADGQPAPVSVHLYQLTATGAFEGADVFALSEHEAATLGADLLQSEAFNFAPGETRSFKRTLKPGAQFLGVAVFFRDIDRAKWRVFAPLAASGPTSLTLSTSALQVSLS
jgi:type VI secretion system protein VasD